MCCEATRSLRGEAALHDTGRRASFGKTTSRRLTRCPHDLGCRKNLRLNRRVRCPFDKIHVILPPGDFHVRPPVGRCVGGSGRPLRSPVTAVGRPGHARKARQGRGCESRRASSAVLRFARAASVLLVNEGTCEGVPRHMSVATVWRLRAILLRPWRSNARLFTSSWERWIRHSPVRGLTRLNVFALWVWDVKDYHALWGRTLFGNVQRECGGVEDQASINSSLRGTPTSHHSVSRAEKKELLRELDPAMGPPEVGWS
jgi:hypothetical protein